MLTVRSAVERIAGANWLRLLGIVCVVMLAVLSLVPKTLRGIGEAELHGSIQHFIGYATTAFVLSLAARRRLNPLYLIAALAVFAGLMEILQHFSPGRSPEIEGFAASSLGAVAGALVAFAIRPPSSVP